ncbi:MAG: tRNA (guanine(10)-N(2))-dimethyltransferase [Candidatus Bathycorpusculaceae bacterium]
MKGGNSAIGFPTELVQEGKVKVLVPKLKAFAGLPSEYAPSKAPVFYNPAMELNRDIAVLALRVHQKIMNREISVCEPLTGSGIRGIRFAAEVKGVKQVLISDINEKATRLASHNVLMNGLNGQITVQNEEANRLLSCYNAPLKRFDAIDVDPFGSPVPYIDSALRALRDGGLLALTATDMAPLCGVHPKACIRKYGGKPLRTEYCQELATRLLAGCLAATAAKQDIGIRMLFSHCTAHYARVYAAIAYGAKKADESLRDMGYVIHCFNCFHREVRKGLFGLQTSTQCSECGSEPDFAGPLWAGKILDRQFCELMEREAKHMPLRNSGIISKTLTLTKQEADAPATYYVLDAICDRLALPVPSVDALLQTLHQKGFQAVRTHFNSKGIKTDASATLMSGLVREVLQSTER